MAKNRSEENARPKRKLELLPPDEQGRPASRITLPVDTEEKPRLDVFLSERLPWRSRNQLKELIEAGRVEVDGRVRKPSYRVRRNEVVTIVVPSPPMPPLAFKPGEITVLYEDEYLVVLNKPAGILTHPTSGHQYDTLTNYLEATFGPKGKRHFICHRLDRETTGTILIAFDPVVRKLIQYQFEKHLVDKEYFAIVKGCFPQGTHRIDLPIGKGENLQAALKNPERKPSLTITSRVVAGEGASVVRANPVTGRQNQIRIHLAARGFPLIGDERYGGPPPPPTCTHFLLHARVIRFFHPVQKLHAEITAPLPPAFRETARFFGLSLPEDCAGEA